MKETKEKDHKTLGGARPEIPSMPTELKFPFGGPNFSGFGGDDSELPLSHNQGTSVLSQFPTSSIEFVLPSHKTEITEPSLSSHVILS